MDVIICIPRVSFRFAINFSLFSLFDIVHRIALHYVGFFRISTHLIEIPFRHFASGGAASKRKLLEGNQNKTKLT